MTVVTLALVREHGPLVGLRQFPNSIKHLIEAAYPSAVRPIALYLITQEIFEDEKKLSISSQQSAQRLLFK